MQKWWNGRQSKGKRGSYLQWVATGYWELLDGLLVARVGGAVECMRELWIWVHGEDNQGKQREMTDRAHEEQENTGKN